MLADAGYVALRDAAFANPRLWLEISDLERGGLPWWKGTGWNLLWMKRESLSSPNDGVVVQRRDVYAMKDSLGRLERKVAKWNNPGKFS